jgi:hypothetical protein
VSEGAFLAVTSTTLRRQKELAERALAQVPDAALTVCLDPETNSLAMLIRHLGGNLASRFSDFLDSDGEKSDRNRNREFEPTDTDTRATLMAGWERGFGCLFDTLAALEPDDLARTVTIRGEPHSVVQALQRALSHVSYHVGQIVLLAKHLRSGAWQSLSIPRGVEGKRVG